MNLSKFTTIALLCLISQLVIAQNGNYDSQQVKCDELISYVEKNGELKETVSTIQLLQSSWLSEVQAYKIENTIVVIAQIYTDNFALNKKKYIFCGISEADWKYFSYPFSDINKTYGERFQKTIFDKRCNCQ